MPPPSYPPGNRATVQPPLLTLKDYASAKKLPVEELKSWGLTEFKPKDFDSGRTVIRIPYFTPDGSESKNIRYRLAMVGEHRFSWRKGSKSMPYGLERLKDADPTAPLFVVEGESDTHTLWHHGFAAVGLPGANAFKTTWLTHFEPFDTVCFCIEPDQGGKALLDLIAKQPVQFRERVRLVRMTEQHKDASALHVADPEGFPNKFHDLHANAQTYTDYAHAQREATARQAIQGCESLASSPDILQELDHSLEQCGLVGERDTAYLLYLALISRVFKDPVSVCVKGLSSSGKSFTLKQVANHFPKNAYVSMTGMSEHALQYGEDDLQHKMLIVYEWRGVKEAGQYALDSMLSEGHIEYRTVEKGEDARLRESVRTRPGPTGFLTTTTRTKLHHDLENRLFSITTSDTEDQTRLIFQEQAREREPRPEEAWIPWHKLSDFLANSSASVTIPFWAIVSRLSSFSSVRLRRDFPRMMTLVQAHAFLHQ